MNGPATGFGAGVMCAGLGAALAVEGCPAGAAWFGAGAAGGLGFAAWSWWEQQPPHVRAQTRTAGLGATMPLFWSVLAAWAWQQAGWETAITAAVLAAVTWVTWGVRLRRAVPAIRGWTDFDRNITDGGLDARPILHLDRDTGQWPAQEKIP